MSASCLSVSCHRFIFSKTGIKIKLLSLNFIFFIAADRNFPPHSEIKYRTFFAGELCAETPSRR